MMFEKKVGLERSRLPFTIIENVVFEDRTLSKEARMLYWALCYHADKQGKCFPSLSTLSKETGSGRHTVVASLRALCSAGYIVCASRVDEKGDRASNLYIIKGKRKREGSSQENHPQFPTEPRVVPGRHSNHTHINQNTGASAPAAEKSPQRFITSLFFRKYKERLGVPPSWARGKNDGQLRDALKRYGKEALAERVNLFFDSPPADVRRWCLRAGYAFGVFVSQLPKLDAALASKARDHSAERECPHCRKLQRHSGLDCLYCGKPMRVQEVHAHVS